MKGGIKEWPEDERPREKLQKAGADSLSDAELLALILRVGDHASHQSAIDLGRNMLQQHFLKSAASKAPARQKQRQFWQHLLLAGGSTPTGSKTSKGLPPPPRYSIISTIVSETDGGSIL